MGTATQVDEGEVVTLCVAILDGTLGRGAYVALETSEIDASG